MSGILLPMVHTTNTSAGEAKPVGIDHIVSLDKFSGTNVVGGGNIVHEIIFTVNAAGNQTSDLVRWRYDDEATRDADYTALLAIVSASL